jgi:hypothetical protein
MENCRSEDTLYDALGNEISPEQQLLMLKWQYGFNKAVLKRYDLSMEDMPPWEDIQTCLTPYVLEKILMLHKPELYVFPHGQVQWAFNKAHRRLDLNKVSRNTLSCGPVDDEKDEPLWKDLDKVDPGWNTSYHPEVGKWRAVVAESDENKENLLRSPVYQLKNINRDVANELQYYLENGLDIVSDLPLYVAILMHHFAIYGGLGGLDENCRRIKSGPLIILNGKRVGSAGKRPIVGTSFLEDTHWIVNSVSSTPAWEYASLRGMLEFPLSGKMV